MIYLIIEVRGDEIKSCQITIMCKKKNKKTTNF